MTVYSYRQNNQISVTTSLMIINVVVFIAGLLSRQNAILCVPYEAGPSTSIFELWGAYSWFTAMHEGEVWRFISYQFVHANFRHLFFNMWALFIFGRAVEAVLGSRRYLAYYLLCGIAGALFASLLGGLHILAPKLSSMDIAFFSHIAEYSGDPLQAWELIPMVGASGSIYGILMASAFLFPHANISLILPPVTMSIRTFAIIVMIIATATILFDGNNAGGEAGHLGGVIMGAIVMYFMRRRMVKNYRR